MPVSVTCQCGKRLRVKDELAGKRIKCPTCGAVMPPFTSPAPKADIRPKAPPTIDSATPEEPAPLNAENESIGDPAQSSPKKKALVSEKGSNSILFFAGLGGAVLLLGLGLCGFGLWYFVLKGNSDASGPLDLPGASGVALDEVSKPGGSIPLKRIFLFFPHAADKAESSQQLVQNMFAGKLAGTYPGPGVAWSQVFPTGTKVVLVGVAFSPSPPNGTKVKVRLLNKGGTVTLQGTPLSINLNGQGEVISLMACYPASGALPDGPHQIEVIINDVKCARLNFSVGN